MGTLTLGAVSVDISDDFDWPDEYAWPKVALQKTFSVTGALLVETNVRQTGRPVTLIGSEQLAWMPRADLEVVRELVESPGVELELVFRDQTFNVMFDHEAGALEATPVADYAEPDATDFFFVTMRFIEVPV